jgi:hypothetical protein
MSLAMQEKEEIVSRLKYIYTMIIIDFNSKDHENLKAER